MYITFDNMYEKVLSPECLSEYYSDLEIFNKMQKFLDLFYSVKNVFSDINHITFIPFLEDCTSVQKISVHSTKDKAPVNIYQVSEYGENYYVLEIGVWSITGDWTQINNQLVDIPL